MGSNSETHYLRSIIPALPSEIASKIRSLCASPANESLLENLVRFLTNADYASDASQGLQGQWAAKQAATRAVLSGLDPLSKKRTRDDDTPTTDAQQPKKLRVSPSSDTHDSGAPVFTLHSVSTTSPIRKKVDITAHQHAIVFTNPSSKAVEASVPLSSIKRAFVVPTRGKSKPHWTVVLLSSDVPDNPKTKTSATTENHQIIFGIDANSATTLTTTSHTANNGPDVSTHPKNSPTLPHIHEFLSKLLVPFIQPSASVFKSACIGVGSSAGGDGIPGVEAYRAAKAGNLWFSAEGILWGESKPCEFWDLKDLIGKTEGVRMVGSGRTFSLILTRRTAPTLATSADDMEVDEEDLGEETEFGMVDGREREGISEWVRNYRNSFGGQSSTVDKGKGKEKASTDLPKTKNKPANAGPITIRTLQEDSDDSDEDFSDDVSDLDGSEATSGEENSDSEDGGGSDDHEGDEDEAEASGKEDEEVEELDPAHHPLLRPGAMPRMSKAALQMAVGIVEDAFTGGATKAEEEDDLEEDELED